MTSSCQKKVGEVKIDPSRSRPLRQQLAPAVCDSLADDPGDPPVLQRIAGVSDSLSAVAAAGIVDGMDRHNNGGPGHRSGKYEK
jgi:hypothetical protein